MPDRRYALFTHDAYGLGHVRRSVRIVRALAERDPGASILLITGSPATHWLRSLPPGADHLHLPTIVTSGEGPTRPATLALGVAELAALRGGITQRALELLEPDVLLVDNFPLGTRLELLPALRELRHRPTRTALGLRDVVDPPEKVQRDWQRDGLYGVVERYYDRVLVYGTREVLDAGEAYGLPPEVSDKLAYCGYVTESPAALRRPAAVRSELGLAGGFLLATVGGGGDGRPLLDAFLGALEHFPERHALLVTGELMADADRAAIRESAGSRPNVLVRDHVANLPELMAAADVVVAMAGYNTSAEILATGARAVLVPRSWKSGEHGAREKSRVDGEQLVRAEGLARLGAVRTLHPAKLAPDALAEAMTAALGSGNGHSPHPPMRLALDGAARVAEELVRLATEGAAR
ncbi:MAG TPA: glycosyltransferase [Thermoanaerobaculia bacterium]|nr:glycosyltransferase [Thermoanaerobaculia bacterium]